MLRTTQQKIAIILLTIVLSLQFLSASAQTITRVITDVETGMAVPYATIYNSDKSVIRSANVDGIFTIDVVSGTTYTVSQIGYKSLLITAERLLLDDAIQMEVLPYELNPVIVSADAALKDIYRAIDSTYNRIIAAYSTPFYLRCYKRDELFKDGKNILDAKAIIDIKAMRLRSAGKGALTSAALKGLNTNSNNDGLPAMPNSAVSPISPLNSFVAGVPKQDESILVFTRLPVDTDSSLLIITFHPKSNYQYSGTAVYTSGRFIIDTKTWNILRIDRIIDNKGIEYQNHVVNTSKRQELWHELHNSMFFTSNGILSKIEQRIVYSLKNGSGERYTWTTVQTYKDISKAEYQQKPSGSYKQTQSIFQQKPITIPDFDARFNLGFP
ncbi:MAG: carboxypeptidase-like regulatory domain-containing protein [Bacteroidales bacterium]|nr:carboxypeptidase-like regulatory domain-containing protein [Bacteroidales bacterium]